MIEPIHADLPTACAMLGVKRSTLYILINEGRIEAVKMGKRTLFPVASLRAFAASLPRVAPRVSASERGGA